MRQLNDRIDKDKLKKLRSASMSSPIHAINFVTFRNARIYRLYGLLLVPYALPKGARPIWAGVHTKDLVGESNEDEIVIVQYPNHNVLIDIFTSTYYERINGIRERGVKELGFSICRKQIGNNKISKGNHFIIRFNKNNNPSEEVLNDFQEITNKYFDIAYLATEQGLMDIFKDVQETDPKEVQFKNIAIVTPNSEKTDKSVVDYETELKNHGYQIIVQQFRTLGIMESMPWAKG